MNRQVQVVRLVSILLRVNYPIGIVPFHNNEKFGFNGPVGDFMKKIDIDHIFAMLTKDEVVFMRNVAKNNKHFQETVRYFAISPE